MGAVWIPSLSCTFLSVLSKRFPIFVIPVHPRITTEQGTRDMHGKTVGLDSPVQIKLLVILSTVHPRIPMTRKSSKERCTKKLKGWINNFIVLLTIQTLLPSVARTTIYDRIFIFHYDQLQCFNVHPSDHHCSYLFGMCPRWQMQWGMVLTE